MPRDLHQRDTRKPTKAEARERVDMCRKMIAAGHYDGEVKKAVAKHFGLSTRTVERYLRRARDLLLAESGKPMLEHRAESLAFYQRVRADQTAPTKDRLRAQERIDELLALPIPPTHRYELSGPNGTPIVTAQQLTPEQERLRLEELIVQAAREAGVLDEVKVEALPEAGGGAEAG